MQLLRRSPLVHITAHDAFGSCTLQNTRRRIGNPIAVETHTRGGGADAINTSIATACTGITNPSHRARRRTRQERLPHQQEDRRVPLPRWFVRATAQFVNAREQTPACQIRLPKRRVRQLRRSACGRCRAGPSRGSRLRPASGPGQRWHRVRAVSWTKVAHSTLHTKGGHHVLILQGSVGHLPEVD